MFASEDPRQNHLLAALPADAYARLLPELTPIAMPLGWVLHESGGHPGYLYFPTHCIVSLLYVTESGASMEVGLAGNEGLVGISLFLGGGTTTSRAVVESAGAGYRIREGVLRREFETRGALHRLALCYTQALIAQMAQTVVCNRHHAVDQQLSRRLLLSLDRRPGNELTVTQEQIASTLGVRRESVTGAAGRLQAAGLIRYARGHITVLDRSGLEQRACECYGVVRKEYDRLLPQPPSGTVATTVRR